MKFHYLKKFIYITEIVNAHYFGSDLLITTTVVKFHYFTFREYAKLIARINLKKRRGDKRVKRSGDFSIHAEPR